MSLKAISPPPDPTTREPLSETKVAVMDQLPDLKATPQDTPSLYDIGVPLAARSSVS